MTEQQTAVKPAELGAFDPQPGLRCRKGNKYFEIDSVADGMVKLKPCAKDGEPRKGEPVNVAAQVFGRDFTMVTSAKQPKPKVERIVDPPDDSTERNMGSDMNKKKAKSKGEKKPAARATGDGYLSKAAIVRKIKEVKATLGLNLAHEARMGGIHKPLVSKSKIKPGQVVEVTFHVSERCGGAEVKRKSVKF